NIPLEKPRHAIGRSTAESLQSGVLWGFGGQVDGLVDKMSKELPAKPTVIATGGLSSFIKPFCECIGHVEPLLTLEGLRLIHERQQR
ncbi:MAG: pantothenate kinase, partial [Clostridiales bacterium]|nr:pantothenate kinase [Clostridiales bacterium]